MKRLLITAMLLCIGGIIWAQEAKETEFKMMVGDTVVWQSFDNCDSLAYKVSGTQFISFKHLHYGEQVEIIAKQVGTSYITATCGDNDSIAIARIIVNEPYVAPFVAKIEKPKTLPFTAKYNFNPPADHFFITVTDPDNHCSETFVKVGDNEAYNNGRGDDRFWNNKTKKIWFYRPEAQGWTDDVDGEFEPFGKSFFPLNAFDNEVDKSDLSKYYVGMDKVLKVDCWVFFVEQQDGSVIRYWVDPANGCTLQRQMGTDEPRVVTVYDLKYTKLYFGPSFKKGLHDTRR